MENNENVAKSDEELIQWSQCHQRRPRSQFLKGNRLLKTCEIVCRKKGRKYKKNNKDKARESSRQWRAKNSERKKAYGKCYRNNEEWNPEKFGFTNSEPPSKKKEHKIIDGIKKDQL